MEAPKAGAPAVVPAVPVVAVVPAAAGPAVVVLVVVPVAPAVVVVAGWDAAVVVSAGFPSENRPPVLAAGFAAAAPPEVAVAALSVAEVEDGVAEEVAPPSEGNRDFWGVAVDVAGVLEGWEVLVPPREKVGFGVVWESVDPPGNLKGEAAACVLGVAPPVVPGVVPNRGFAPVPALPVAGVSAGLSLFRFPNRPPAAAPVDGVEPNNGFEAAFPPNRPPVCCD